MKKPFVISAFCLLLINIGFAQNTNRRTYIVKYKNKQIIEELRVVKIQTGVWIPFGNLSNVLQPSPSFEMGFRLPLSSIKSRIDFGISAFFPVSGNQVFTYQLSDTILRPKIENGVGGIILYHILIPLNNGLILEPCVGWGIYDFITNLEEPNTYYINPNTNRKEPKHYEVDSKYYRLGFNLRKKSNGLSVVYNYTPTHRSGKVSRDFGNSSLNMALFHTF